MIAGRLARDVEAVLARIAVGDGRDELHGGQDGARLALVGSRRLQEPPAGLRRRADPEGSQRVVLRCAVEGDDPLVREQAAPAAGELRGRRSGRSLGLRGAVVTAGQRAAGREGTGADCCDGCDGHEAPAPVDVRRLAHARSPSRRGRNATLNRRGRAADESGVEHRRQRILLETDRHRIRGTVHLSRDGYRSRISDLLNASERDFLPLTDATVEPLGRRGGPAGPRVPRGAAQPCRVRRAARSGRGGARGPHRLRRSPSAPSAADERGDREPERQPVPRALRAPTPIRGASRATPRRAAPRRACSRRRTGVADSASVTRGAGLSPSAGPIQRATDPDS